MKIQLSSCCCFQRFFSYADVLVRSGKALIRSLTFPSRCFTVLHFLGCRGSGSVTSLLVMQIGHLWSMRRAGVFSGRPLRWVPAVCTQLPSEFMLSAMVKVGWHGCSIWQELLGRQPAVLTAAAAALTGLALPSDHAFLQLFCSCLQNGLILQWEQSAAVLTSAVQP